MLMPCGTEHLEVAIEKICTAAAQTLARGCAVGKVRGQIYSAANLALTGSTAHRKGSPQEGNVRASCAGAERRVHDHCVSRDALPERQRRHVALQQVHLRMHVGLCYVGAVCM